MTEIKTTLLEALSSDDKRKVLRNLDEPQGEIFVSRDYNKFRYHKQNRPISLGHVQGLIKSIKDQGQLTPIQVTKSFFVKDGQHRLEACRELGLPVLYFFEANESNETNFLDAVKHIQTGKQWTKHDYLISYAQTIPDYAEFLQFHRTLAGGIFLSRLKNTGHPDRGLSYTHFLYFQTPLVGKSFEVFRLGEMHITDSQRKTASELDRYLSEIIFMEQGRWAKFFISDKPLQVFWEFYSNVRFNKDFFLGRLKEAASHELLVQATLYDVAVQIEQLYNWKLSASNRIKVAERFLSKGYRTRTT